MRINYSHSYIIVVLLKNKETEMYKKLLNLLKEKYISMLDRNGDMEYAKAIGGLL